MGWRCCAHSPASGVQRHGGQYGEDILVNQEAYPNIRKVVRAADVLLGWVFTAVKLSLLFAVVVVVIALVV